MASFCDSLARSHYRPRETLPLNISLFLNVTPLALAHSFGLFVYRTTRFPLCATFRLPPFRAYDFLDVDLRGTAEPIAAKSRDTFGS